MHALRWLTDLTSFAVATVMFSTTTLIAIQMIYVKHWPAAIAAVFFLLYGFIDGVPHQTSLCLRFSQMSRFVLGSIIEKGPRCTLFVLRRVLIN